MTDLGIIFLTGLTTGGLSCLAVQGGLLASSVAYRAEQTLHQLVPQRTDQPDPPTHQPLSQDGRNQATPAGVPKSYASSIMLFLFGKLVAYTALGLGLGWLGSVLQLTSFMQAVMQLVIGIFMVGSALRMLNVHSFFRYFVLEPPAFVTRYIRRTAKNGTDSMIAPTFLGVLTVLIPCGVTQVMMATAIATGNPLEGAAILFAFTLGASPLFFALAYLTTQLSQRLEARFVQVVAVTVLVLGLVSINSGLTLAGSPLAFSSWIARSAPPLKPQALVQQRPTTSSVSVPSQLSSSTAATAAGNRDEFILETLPKFAPLAGNQLQSSADVVTVASTIVQIDVLDYGYSPNVINAPANQGLQLKLVTDNVWSCARAFVIPSLGVQQVLPDTGETMIDLPPQPTGSTLFYTCSMGMYYGTIQFQ